MRRSGCLFVLWISPADEPEFPICADVHIVASRCNRMSIGLFGYFAGYLPNLSCYVYGPFGRCTIGVGLLL